ncbi:MAG: GNAT family N-acetyltransferase, partial [Lachnospiraceae bacterium]|nr:GNAT family N-acetyltransferase [Lachnospiraceae bacterium]
HYEGIDERVLEEIVTDRISIGDYVLTGGELPALVMMDAVSRLVPGVLHNEESAQTETFDNDLLEYPQYTRPECWHGKQVPSVLLTGDHGKIIAWRLEQAKERTKMQRPDLYAAYEYRQQVIRWLSQKKRLHIHMMELLKRGLGEILAFDPEDGTLLLEHTGVVMLTAAFREAGERLLDASPVDLTGRLFCVCQKELIPVLEERYQTTEARGCCQAYYTRGVPLPVRKDLEIRVLDESFAGEIFAEYHELITFEELEEHLTRGHMVGAFVQKELAGYIGIHSEGALGMLQVRPKYRRQGIAAALESYMINKALTRGEIPFAQIFEGNEPSLCLQKKLGLNVTDIILWWVF